MARKDWATLFIKYHAENPHMWDAYQDAAADAFQYSDKFSTKLLNERIRWEARKIANTDFKTTNSFTAYYARLLMWRFPQYMDSMVLKRIDIDGECNLRDINTWNKQYWNQFCKSKHLKLFPDQ